MDVAVYWNTERAAGDWSFATGDLKTGVDIDSAVLVSLFTDRLAAPGFVPPDGDRRGWWGDSYSDRPIGPRLWMLDRARRAGQAPSLVQARDHREEAPRWLVEDGIAAKVEVQTAWLSRDALGIAVTVTKPDKTTERFDYAWAWTG